MDRSTPPSSSASRSATPNPATNSRFTSQASTAEDLLKEQTVGLVHLSDFRKRRAEALDFKDRENRSRTGTPIGSGASTPGDGTTTPQPFKRKRKTVAKAKLSFGGDENGEDDSGASSILPPSRSETPGERNSGDGEASATENEGKAVKKRLGPRAGVSFIPKALTKAALLRDAQQREQSRKDFQAMRDAAKATDFILPFSFYDGTSIPGGKCRMKKGDHIWLFLDKARKVGAELGVGGGDKSKREWARVSVDDLMLVRGDIIIPHHYEFYYFMSNKTMGFNGPLFDHSSNPTDASPIATDDAETATYDPLGRPNKKDEKPLVPEAELEGFREDQQITKVVDRRWYEKNKHIYPASIWEEFDPEKDYTNAQRKDTSGNAFFFS